VSSSLLLCDCVTRDPLILPDRNGNVGQTLDVKFGSYRYAQLTVVKKTEEPSLFCFVFVIVFVFFLPAERSR
jgi:hypothetical protein